MEVAVEAIWDHEAGVWVAESDDVPGLATGADTIDELVVKLKVVIPELLEANGLVEGDGEEIVLALTARRRDLARPADAA